MPQPNIPVPDYKPWRYRTLILEHHLLFLSRRTVFRECSWTNSTWELAVTHRLEPRKLAWESLGERNRLDGIKHFTLLGRPAGAGRRKTWYIGSRWAAELEAEMGSHGQRFDFWINYVPLEGVFIGAGIGNQGPAVRLQLHGDEWEEIAEMYSWRTAWFALGSVIYQLRQLP